MEILKLSVNTRFFHFICHENLKRENKNFLK
jgi:hypothetical protein